MNERTEQATPYKLAKVREQGKVIKSIELNYALTLFVSVCFFWHFWPNYLIRVKELVVNLINQIGNLCFSSSNIIILNKLIFYKLIYLLLPFAGILIGSAIIANIGQSGWLWSFKSLSFQWQRLSPKTNCQRLFDKRLLFDLGKNIVKLIGFSSVIAIYLCHNIPKLIILTQVKPDFFPRASAHFIINALLLLSLMLIFLALIDYLYRYWKFHREQRMTKEELKEEFKHREGNPKIKMKIRQLQHKLRQKTASLTLIKKADVIITNPTHLAIALQYNKQTMPAPKVLAKAQGSLVSPIKSIARRYDIPIIEHKIFAQALYYSLEINQYIKEEHFPIAAGIFSELYQQKGRAQ